MTIRALAEAIANAAGWSGAFTYDTSKPDGMPRKVMDISRLAALGWTAKTRFEDGIKTAYDWYAANRA
jgi:GDP-L-fucose synthase